MGRREGEEGGREGGIEGGRESGLSHRPAANLRVTSSLNMLSLFQVLPVGYSCNVHVSYTLTSSYHRQPKALSITRVGIR